MLGKISYTPKGDITLIDYVVYKWDKDGNYAGDAEPGRLVTSHAEIKPAPANPGAGFFMRSADPAERRERSSSQ